MIYKKLGKTGLTVSRLGFGAMRLPMIGEGKDSKVNRDLAIPMFHKAFELGVTYVDTAIGYCNSDSQVAVGEALKGWRNKVIVSTKNNYYGTDETTWWTHLENSLKRLNVEYIDIYNHHGMNWKNYEAYGEKYLAKWMHKAIDQKLIRHICTSVHDSPENIIKLIDTGYFEVITLQYNLLDRANENAIARASEKGLGVIVMGPVGGGRLGNSSKVLEGLVPGINRVPQLALRFVLDNPNVTVALSGMGSMEMLMENVPTASLETPLSPADSLAIQDHLSRMKSFAQLYCTGCNYCLPCPRQVAIPKIFERYNVGRVYGLWDVAKNQYAGIGANEKDLDRKADSCNECGACEKKCPQNIPIRKQLKEAHAALANS